MSLRLPTTVEDVLDAVDALNQIESEIRIVWLALSAKSIETHEADLKETVNGIASRVRCLSDAMLALNDAAREAQTSIDKPVRMTGGARS